MMEQLEAPDSEVTASPEVAPEASADTSFDSSLTDSDSESLDTEATAEDDDSEEVDYEGEKYKLPKKLKDALLRQQDYTQKTQAVAEQKRAVEAHAQQVQQHEQMSRQYVADYAKLMSKDETIAQFRAINWEQLDREDPVRSLTLQRQMREQIDERNELASSITQKQRQQEIEAQRTYAKRIEEAVHVLKRDIKDWSPELDMKLKQTAMSIGFSEEEARVSDPRTIKLVHKAYLYDQLMAAKTAKPEPVTQERPVTRITASKATVKTPEKMTDKEFAQWRRNQIRNRN